MIDEYSISIQSIRAEVKTVEASLEVINRHLLRLEAHEELRSKQTEKIKQALEGLSKLSADIG